MQTQESTSILNIDSPAPGRPFGCRRNTSLPQDEVWFLSAGAGIMVIVPSVQRRWAMWFAFNTADELETNPQLTQVPVVLLTPPELSTLFQLKIYPITLGKLRSPSQCRLLSKSQSGDVNPSSMTMISMSRNLFAFNLYLSHILPMLLKIEPSEHPMVLEISLGLK